MRSVSATPRWASHSPGPSLARNWNVAYAIAHGKLPDAGYHLDHTCRVRHCVRHTEPVTIRENLMRGPTTFAAINAAKTHCRNGHEFTDANTYRPPDGSRMCRECSRAKDRRAYWRNKQRLADT